jgi:membrane dipeptidase
MVFNNRSFFSSLQMALAICIAFVCGISVCGISKAQQDAPNRYQISERAAAIHQRGYVFDGHNDLPWEVRTKTTKLFDELDISKPQPKLHTDIARLRAGNVGAQFWSVYVPVETIAAGNAFQTTKEQIDLVHKMIALYPETFELALNAQDVERIEATGKIASLIGMEGGHSIEGSIGKLRQLHSMGARYMTLTHSETLEWADSATDLPRSDGLSPFGEEVVLEMNRLGMLVDISHVSPATMHDALRISKAPVIFSHSSARAIPGTFPTMFLRSYQKMVVL